MVYKFYHKVIISNQDIKDEGILWKTNFSRFHQEFIDEVLISNFKRPKMKCLLFGFKCLGAFFETG